MRWPMFQKIQLPRHNLSRDVENCLLALMDRANQEFPATNFVAHVILNLARLSFAGGDDVFVDVADSQMWDLLIVQGDLIFTIHFFHDYVGKYIVLRRSCEDLTGTRIEPRNAVSGLLHILDINSHSPRDFGEPSPAQIFHMLQHNLVLESVFSSVSLQLN